MFPVFLKPLLIIIVLLFSLNTCVWSQADEKKSVILKVMSINIRHNKDFWDERFPLIADEIVRLQPDLIGLQEVHIGTDQSQVLLELIKERDEGLEYGLYERLKTGLNGMEGEGIAIFTRFPKVKGGFADLEYGRPVVFNRVRVNDELLIDFYNVHMHHRGGDGIRVPQMKKILKFMKKKDKGHIIFLAGDLNTQPGTRPVEMILGNGFIDTYCEFHGDDEPELNYTAPIILSKEGVEQNPQRRIDYVMARIPPDMKDRVKILDSVVCFRNHNPDGLYPSDHLGVMITFEIFY